jgi:hypothetical protein
MQKQCPQVFGSTLFYIMGHDGIYYGPHYSALKGKSCYNYARSIIYHKQCSELRRL